MRISWLYLSFSGIIRHRGLAYLIFPSLCQKEKGGGVKGKMFSLGLCLFLGQTILLLVLVIHERGKKMDYCGPDGNIPHDQTNQSPWWDAGVTQPCSNTPFHSLSATNTWSPINGPLRTHEEGCFSTASVFMADDFIITHPFSQRRKAMSSLITSPTMWTPTL